MKTYRWHRSVGRSFHGSSRFGRSCVSVARGWPLQPPRPWRPEINVAQACVRSYIDRRVRKFAGRQYFGESGRAVADDFGVRDLASREVLKCYNLMKFGNGCCSKAFVNFCLY